MNLRETFAISRLSRVITHRRNTRSHATDQRWHGVPRDTTWGNKRGRNGREPRVARIPHMWFFLSLATSNKRTMRTALYERATQFCLPVTHFRKLTTWLRVHLDHEARWRDTAKQQRQATPWTEFGGSRSYTRSAIDSQPDAAWGASTIRNVETSSSWARYVGHPCLSKTILSPPVPLNRIANRVKFLLANPPSFQFFPSMYNMFSDLSLRSNDGEGGRETVDRSD